MTTARCCRPMIDNERHDNGWDTIDRLAPLSRFNDLRSTRRTRTWSGCTHAFSPASVRTAVNEVRGEREKRDALPRNYFLPDSTSSRHLANPNRSSFLPPPSGCLIGSHNRGPVSASRKQRSRARNIEGSPRGRTGRADKRARRSNTGVGGPALRIASTRLPTDTSRSLVAARFCVRYRPTRGVPTPPNLALFTAGGRRKKSVAVTNVLCLSGAHAYPTHSAAH